MPPLETLFRLEIEFHRRLRTLALDMSVNTGVHTSYAIQGRYESLLHSIGQITASDIEQLETRLITTADTRDVLAARDSMKQMMGCCPSLQERG